MKILLLSILLLSPYLFSQTDSSNCNQLYGKFQGDLSVRKLPQIVGGIDSLQSRLQYPDSALSHKIEGIVYVKILIDSTGEPVCPHVMKGIGYGCNKEAIRLVMGSNYTPGIIFRRPAMIPVVIPVKFKLPK